MNETRTYSYHFRAYRSDTNAYIGEYHWVDITPREFNKRLQEVYGTPFFESIISLIWLKHGTGK